MLAFRTCALGKTFRTAGDVVCAVHDVDLEIARGHAVLVWGPSGSGKTTLLNLLGLLCRPSAGTIELEGQTVTHLPEHFLSRLRRSRLGFIFQQYNLLRGYSALDNIGLPLVPTGVSEKERRRRAGELLVRFGLEGRGRFPVNHLSAGEQQRVAIARTLIGDPAIILADEPDANLDVANRELLWSVLGQLKDRGRTLVVASHNPRWRALPLIDQVVELQNGRAREVAG
jgi:putative ABC transport system ATP-binding protein